MMVSMIERNEALRDYSAAVVGKGQPISYPSGLWQGAVYFMS